MSFTPISEKENEDIRTLFEGVETIPLEQGVFDGQPDNVVVACVDFDGLLKFGDSHIIRYTWASERWRGANWIEKVEESDYEPLTSLRRDS